MLLQYALLAAQTPLQAGIPTTLTLEISNGGRQLVQVTSVVIALPIGTTARDLTAGTGFQSSASSGWNLAQSGGVLTLTPLPGGGAVGPTGIVITIANVAVNDQPGTAAISIVETAAVVLPFIAPVFPPAAMVAAALPALEALLKLGDKLEHAQTADMPTILAGSLHDIASQLEAAFAKKA